MRTPAALATPAKDAHCLSIVIGRTASRLTTVSSNFAQIGTGTTISSRFALHLLAGRPAITSKMSLQRLRGGFSPLVSALPVPLLRRLSGRHMVALPAGADQLLPRPPHMVSTRLAVSLKDCACGARGDQSPAFGDAHVRGSALAELARPAILGF